MFDQHAGSIPRNAKLLAVSPSAHIPEPKGDGAVAVHDQTWDMVAGRLDSFAAAWERADEPPELRDYLPTATASVCYAALLELIKLDMEYRWNQGAPKWVEDYLEEHSLLADSGQVPLDLIIEEFHIRQEQGRKVEAEEYLSRFPQVADRLHGLLDLPGGCASARLLTTQTRPVREAIAQFKAGDRLEDFDLVSKLGAGSFATVFLAWQRSMQRWVALKISAAGGDEPQTLAQLEHPFIVRVFDVRDIDGGKLRLLYMEYVRGGTLEDIIGRINQIPRCDWSGRRMLKLLDEMLEARHETPPQDSINRQLLARANWEEAVCILGSHLALAISYAQGKGVLHRDIKPANILLSGAAFPKLADFNVSFGSQVQGATAAAHFGGSMAYMSPEQLQAMHPASPVRPEDLDVTSDVYSLGILLWELLTGERPFPRLEKHSGWVDAVEQLTASRQSGVREEALERFPAAAPPALKPLLLQCLDADPAKRFSDADGLARQLLLCLNQDVQRLLWRPALGWLEAALRWPLAAILVCVLTPNLLFSSLNIAYNKRAVADGWAPDLFDNQVTIVNLAAYSIGVALFLLAAVPASRAISASRRGKMPTTPPETTIWRALRLAPIAATLTLVLWACCGIVFPVWTHVVVGHAALGKYGHFFLSQLICGALAGLVIYFVLTFLALRVWVPAMLSPTDASSKTADLLGRAPRIMYVGLVVYALIPSLCLVLLSLSLSLGEASLPFSYMALGLIGAGGFVWIVWLSREIRRDASALRTALSPDPVRSEKPSLFEDAQRVWSSVQS